MDQLPSTPKTEEEAAIVIQSAYRSYCTRRELVGLSVRASTKNQWSQIYDFIRFSKLHDQLSSPDIPGVQVRWRNAGFAGSRIGKGLLKMEVTANSLLLLSTHWLELVDHEHRYGSNLNLYHIYWMGQPTRQSFFWWLDHGEGKELSLDECPRSKLENERVTYLTPERRKQYVVVVQEGRLVYRESGELVHTLPEGVGDDVDPDEVLPDALAGDSKEVAKEKKNRRNMYKFIYVTDTAGNLYIARKIKGKFHHTINPSSGHYHPKSLHFEKLIENLKAQGVDFSKVKVSNSFYED